MAASEDKPELAVATLLWFFSSLKSGAETATDGGPSAEMGDRESGLAPPVILGTAPPDGPDSSSELMEEVFASMVRPRLGEIRSHHCGVVTLMARWPLGILLH